MKCIINGKIVLKDKVCDNLAVIFDEKIQKIADVNEIVFLPFISATISFPLSNLSAISTVIS